MTRLTEDIANITKTLCDKKTVFICKGQFDAGDVIFLFPVYATY